MRGEMGNLNDFYPATVVSWMHSGPLGNAPVVPQLFFQSSLPLDWWKKSKDGITLKDKIYIRKPEGIPLTNLNGMKLLFHELIHVRQFHRIGSFWWLNYIFDSSKIEEEAYRESHDWTLKYITDFPEFAVNYRTLIGDELTGHRCGLQKH